MKIGDQSTVVHNHCAKNLGVTPESTKVTEVWKVREPAETRCYKVLVKMPTHISSVLVVETKGKARRIYGEI